MDSFHLSDRTPEDFGSQWNHAVLSPSNSTGNPRESHEDSPSAAFSIQTPNHPTNHTHHHALRNGLGSEMVSNIESVLMTPSFVRPSSSGGSTSGGVGGVGIPWSHQVMGGGHLMESLSMPERSEEEQTQAMLRMMMLDEPISQNEINSFHSTIADGSSHVLQHTSNHTEVSGYASSGSASHRPQNPSQTSMRRSGSSPTDLNQPTAHIASYFQNILREERESVHMSTPPVAHYTGMSNVTSPETYIDRLTELAYSTKPILFVYPILEGSSCREFDISGQATRRFGVFHGQRICKPYNDFCALTGTIVGVGSDGALWWHRDGDAAAIRLALLPEHMTKHGMPKVIGAAILGRAEQMVQNSAPYFPISNNGIHGDCHE